MKTGDLVRLNESMVLYYESLGRSDLAKQAREAIMMVVDTVVISANDHNCKLVTCLTTSESESGTEDFHSTDLVVL